MMEGNTCIVLGTVLRTKSTWIHPVGMQAVVDSVPEFGLVAITMVVVCALAIVIAAGGDLEGRCLDARGLMIGLRPHLQRNPLPLLLSGHPVAVDGGPNPKSQVTRVATTILTMILRWGLQWCLPGIMMGLETVLSHSNRLAATKRSITHLIRSKVSARSSTVISVTVTRMVILGGLETSLLRSLPGIRMVGMVMTGRIIRLRMSVL
mmetsp:Transcript_24993/g.41222  ORF Transcript_24993/g.41222 Transcript_24993/m.41222 type:complete len:207 (+) Transcript_24993:292-912(+)